ncbi:MAG TPA: hypothetical protein VF989_13905 [Polyangiaceae bacterium]|jgi:hypothetical protein
MKWSWLFAASAAVALSGCGGGDDSPPPSFGTAVADWSIDGFKDPDQCDRGGVGTFSISIWTWQDQQDQFVGEFLQDCRAFATSIDLSTGGYYGEAVLLDPDGFERTTIAPLGSFSIFGGDVVGIPVEFPANSFF